MKLRDRETKPVPLHLPEQGAGKFVLYGQAGSFSRNAVAFGLLLRG
jgi:hypothetical protein